MEPSRENTIKIAIVILNWNGRKLLEQFLPTAVEHTRPDGMKLYVADNGSTDESIDFIRSNYPEIQLVLLDKNYGFAGGYNKALAQIYAEYYVLLNSDVMLTENWAGTAIRLMDSDPKIAAAAPKIKAFRDKNSFEHAGAAGGFIDKFGYPFCKGRIISEIEKDEGQYDTISEVFWASGACLIVRGKLYQQFGGLDADFFAHMEEIDLCWRLKNAGYKILSVNNSEIYHLGAATLEADSPQKLFLNYRNNLIMLLKNLPKGKVLHLIFIRLVLDGFSAGVYLASFKISLFFAVLKAHFAFYAQIRKTLKKRKKLKISKKFHKETYKKSIIVSFFIRKQKKFKDLDF